MTNEEIARFFNTTRPFIQGNPDLRDPQVEGWFRRRQPFRNRIGHNIIKDTSRLRPVAQTLSVNCVIYEKITK